MSTRWTEHEKYIRTLLHLDGTVSSGNKFHDPGDAVAREHYQDRAYRLYAECKSTINKSFALSRVALASHGKRAMEYGKMFVFPVRFYADGVAFDYVVLRADDFSEILDRAEASTNGEAIKYLGWVIDKITNPSIHARASHALRVLTGD